MVVCRCYQFKNAYMNNSNDWLEILTIWFIKNIISIIAVITLIVIASQLASIASQIQEVSITLDQIHSI